MNLRSFQDSDLSWLLPLEQSCFGEGDAWQEHDFRNACYTPDNANFFYIITADENNEPVGYFAIEGVSEDCVYLANLVIKPEHRGKGMATQVLNMLASFPVVTLDVRQSNVSARTLYEKFGFKQIDRKKDFYKSPVEDGLVMEYRK